MAKNTKDKQKEYDSKRKDTRGRNWWFVLYPDDLPDNFLDVLKSVRAKMVLSPFHNQDTNSDGSPKKPHYHVMFMFDNYKSEAQLIGLFKSLFGETDTGSIPGVATITASNCLVHDRGGTVRYLAHLDNPEKYQYDVNEIQGFNGADVMELLKHSLSETQDVMKAMQNYIIDNEITELCDFAVAIENNAEWYLTLTTKATVYFNAFIRSYRHKREKEKEREKALGALADVVVDEETGEVIE